MFHCQTKRARAMSLTPRAHLPVGRGAPRLTSVITRDAEVPEVVQEIRVVRIPEERLRIRSKCLFVEEWQYRNLVDPPMTAITALISGSAKAAFESRARSCALAPTRRVVGDSIVTRPNRSRKTRMPISCTSGNTPAPAHDGETTATWSPRRSLGGASNRGASLIRSTVLRTRIPSQRIVRLTGIKSSKESESRRSPE